MKNWAFIIAMILATGHLAPSHSRLFRPNRALGKTAEWGNVRVVYEGEGEVTGGAPPSDSASASASATGEEGVIFGITNIESEDPLGAEMNEGEGYMRRLGSFVIVNAEMSSFILQMMFSNGSLLKHEDARFPIVVRMENLELRYKDFPLGRDIVRKLSSGRFHGGGQVYEVEFLPEHLQNRYEIELWGAPNWVDGRRARMGVYKEEIFLGLEALP